MRGQKADRRSGYPRTFLKDTYFDALDAVALDYPYPLDAIALTKRYLDEEGVRIREIDEVFHEIDNANLADKTSSTEKIDAWWETIKDSLCLHFAYDNKRPEKTAKAADTRNGKMENAEAKEKNGSAAANANRAAQSPAAAPAPTDGPDAADRESAHPSSAAASEHTPLPPAAAPEPAPDAPASLLQQLKAALTSSAVLPFAPALDDTAFLAQLMPPDFAAALAACASCTPAALMDAAAPRSAAFAAFDFFAHDQGVRFSRLVERCARFLRDAHGPALFAALDKLLENAARTAERPAALDGARSALSRFADGNAARATAFMLLLAVVGPENHRLVARAAAQPLAAHAGQR